MSSLPRVIVTRPQREAQAWVSNLRLGGMDAVALPLICIGPAPDPAVLQLVWGTLDQFDAVLFVSGNAVEHFFAQRPLEFAHPLQGVQGRLRAFVTGPGSHAALVATGANAQRIDVPLLAGGVFDSEALWERVKHHMCQGYRVLIVRGSDVATGTGFEGTGRDWFGEQAAAAGAQVAYVAAYARVAPVWTDTQRAWIAQAAGDGSVWLFSSGQALNNLKGSLPQQTWGHAKAVATHARIAQAARMAGFGTVRESSPLLADITASIESLA